MIQVDIGPSLANINARQQLNPLSAFISGQQSGQQSAVQQNALATMARQNQARSFAPAAMRGDQNALAQMAALDPDSAMKSAQYAQVDPKSLMDRSGAILLAGKAGGPQAWASAVQQVSQLTGQTPDPHELDFSNADNVIAQHQTLTQALEQRNSDRSYDLQKGSQQIQERTLDATLANQKFTQGVQGYEAALKGYDAANQLNLNGAPVPQLSDFMAGGKPFAAAQAGGTYPGPDGITTADQGGTFQQGTAGGQTNAQPVPQPSAPNKALRAVTLDASGAPNAQEQADFMSALPPNAQGLVKGLASYNLDPSKIPAKQRLQLESAAQMYDPNFNPAMYPQRMAMNKAVQTGQYAMTLNSSEKVIQHMALLKEYADALQNGNVQTINAIKNRVSAEFGGASATNFSVLAQGVGTELAKAMKGTGTVDVGSIEEAQKAFGTDLGPAQISGAIGTGMHMLASAVDPISNRYQEVMGKPLQWAGGRTSTALQKLGIDPAEFGGGSTGSAGGTAAASGNPTIVNGYSIEEVK